MCYFFAPSSKASNSHFMKPSIITIISINQTLQVLVLQDVSRSCMTMNPSWSRSQRLLGVQTSDVGTGGILQVHRANMHVGRYTGCYHL